jgi:hypothetical protein
VSSAAVRPSAAIVQAIGAGTPMVFLLISFYLIIMMKAIEMSPNP